MTGPHVTPAAVTTPPVRPMPKPGGRGIDRQRPEAGNPAIVLTYLRLHWLMILFCGSLIGAPLAYLAWTMLPSKYESYALLQVASTPTAIADQGDPNRGRTAFQTYLKTQAQLIKSEFVLNAALNDPKYRIAELSTLSEQKDPIKFLDEKLVVNSSEGSEIIRVSLEGDRPDDIRLIVDAVKDAYYREVVEKDLKRTSELKLKVEQAKTALEGLMKSKSTAPVPALAGGPAPTAQPPAPFPPATGGIIDPNLTPAGAAIPIPGAGVNAAAVALGESDAVKRAKFPILVSRVSQLTDEIERIPSAIKEKQTDIASLKQQIEVLRQGPPGADVLAAVAKDPEVIIKQAEAAKWRRDYEYLKNVTNNPNSDRIQKMKAQAEQAEAEAERIKFEKAKLVETSRRQVDANKLFVSLDTAERSLRSLMERDRVARKLLEDARRELAEMPPEVEKAEHKGPVVDPQKTDLLTHDDMYRRLTAQLIGLEFELQSPPRVSKRQDASVPSQKDVKKQIMATSVAGLLGFALMGVGVIAFETRARKVSSLSELKTVGTVPVVGVIPWQPENTTVRDPARRADMNEAIDKLRSYVVQTWVSRGATTIAITSALGDEGKSFAAFGLAGSLAQAGYKTLLIDFDLRVPTLHQYAGVPNEVGVCELLRGETDARSAVVGLPNGLRFLPAGKWSDDARQAAVGGRLEGMLARLREPFDCVVLHGNALLTVAETVEIARRSEVVLLCALYRETRMPLLKRAADRLVTMEIPYTGVVYLGATANEALY